MEQIRYPVSYLDKMSPRVIFGISWRISGNSIENKQ